MTKRSAPALCILTTFSLLLVAGVARAQQACLHDVNESQAERTRRQAALGAARFINTVENAMKGESGEYKPLSAFAFATAPTVLRDGRIVRNVEVMKFDGSEALPGFEARLTTDGKTYSFLITDKTDPCRFTYFSDWKGVIFEGRVIR